MLRNTQIQNLHKFRAAARYFKNTPILRPYFKMLVRGIKISLGNLYNQPDWVKPILEAEHLSIQQKIVQVISSQMQARLISNSQPADAYLALLPTNSLSQADMLRMLHAIFQDESSAPETRVKKFVEVAALIPSDAIRRRLERCFPLFEPDMLARARIDAAINQLIIKAWDIDSNAVAVLADRLRTLTSNHFATKADIRNINNYIFEITRAFNLNRPALEKHDGWQQIVKQVLLNIICAILGVGVIYAAAAINNKVKTGNFFFFRPPTATMLDQKLKQITDVARAAPGVSPK